MGTSSAIARERRSARADPFTATQPDAPRRGCIGAAASGCVGAALPASACGSVQSRERRTDRRSSVARRRRRGFIPSSIAQQDTQSAKIFRRQHVGQDQHRTRAERTFRSPRQRGDDRADIRSFLNVSGQLFAADQSCDHGAITLDPQRSNGARAAAHAQHPDPIAGPTRERDDACDDRQRMNGQRDQNAHRAGC